MLPKDILHRAHGNQKSYAEALTQTAELLHGHEMYQRMAMFTALMQLGNNSRYGIPEDRPIVHIDIGSGTGHFLAELSHIYQERQKPHCIIGVEINEILARDSAQRLLSAECKVETHIHGEERVQKKGRRNWILRRNFPIHNKTIETMNVTPDNRILIIQDDARKHLGILMAVLQKLRSQGITHVDTISMGLPGVGGDIAMQDAPDLDRYRSSEHLTRENSGRLVDELTLRTADLAKELLGRGGLLILLQRARRGAYVANLYRQIMGKDISTDDADQIAARMLIGTFLLKEKATNFQPKAGAVLFPRLEEIENSSNLQYAVYNPLEPGRSKGNSEDFERDLFGLALILRQPVAESNPLPKPPKP